MKKLFTSESVGAGHPDKICDQISDAILDNILKQDPESRVAVETFASNHLIVIGGEVTTKGYTDVIKVAWDVLLPLGYTYSDFTILSNLNSQSPDINQGVDKEDGDIGAGDQGIMFGFATNEAKDLMPLPITLSHQLMSVAEDMRLSGEFKWAKSDMKAQVTIDYSGDTPKIDTVLMSVQHDADYNDAEFKKFIKEKIMKRVALDNELNTDFKTFINPTGKFVIGGPQGDTGLTGRKIIVDTYGGMGRHGGGAFSGKDYTKVDRSAAYAARWVAKHIVKANLADKAEIQLSYAIGISEPTSISLDTFGTNKVDNDLIAQKVVDIFNLSPGAIIKDLNLKKVKYADTAKFGHFGATSKNKPWEKIDSIKLKELKSLLK